MQTFLFAGHDTTAAALAWAMYLLATHPDVADKLYREIYSAAEVAGGPEHLDLRRLQQMTYLEAFIKVCIVTSQCIIGSGGFPPKGSRACIPTFRVFQCGFGCSLLTDSSDYLAGKAHTKLWDAYMHAGVVEIISKWGVHSQLSY